MNREIHVRFRESLGVQSPGLLDPRFVMPGKYGAIRIGMGNDYELTTSPENAAPVRARSEDGIVVYKGAYPGVDVLYALRPGDMEQMFERRFLGIRTRLRALARLLK